MRAYLALASRAVRPQRLSAFGLRPPPRAPVAEWWTGYRRRSLCAAAGDAGVDEQDVKALQELMEERIIQLYVDHDNLLLGWAGIPAPNECREALEQFAGDMEAASEWLGEKAHKRAISEDFKEREKKAKLHREQPEQRKKRAERRKKKAAQLKELLKHTKELFPLHEPPRCGLQKQLEGTWYHCRKYNNSYVREWLKFKVSTDGIGSLAVVFPEAKNEYFRTRGLPHVGGRVPLEDQTVGGVVGWDPTYRTAVRTGSLKQTATDRIEVTFYDTYPYLHTTFGQPDLNSHTTFYKASATECEEERERRERILMCELDNLEREERDDIDPILIDVSMCT